MKAAQEKFVASYQSTGDSSCQEKEDDAKFPKDSGVELTSEDSPSTACALCHDSASTSPICFLILVQKSKLLNIAEKSTPSWERSSVPTLMEREGEALGTITADGTGEEGEMNITDEPWHWIQDASGNARTPTNLQESEDIILEFNHDGPPPGIQDTVGWVPEATPSVAAAGHPAESKSSTEITEVENDIESRATKAKVTGSKKRAVKARVLLL